LAKIDGLKQGLSAQRGVPENVEIAFVPYDLLLIGPHSCCHAVFPPLQPTGLHHQFFPVLVQQGGLGNHSQKMVVRDYRHAENTSLIHFLAAPPTNRRAGIPFYSVVFIS
jgi:hypothetical protein